MLMPESCVNCSPFLADSVPDLHFTKDLLLFLDERERERERKKQMICDGEEGFVLVK